MPPECKFNKNNNNFNGYAKANYDQNLNLSMYLWQPWSAYRRKSAYRASSYSHFTPP